MVKVANLCSVPDSPGNCLYKFGKDIKNLFTLLKLTSDFCCSIADEHVAGTVLTLVKTKH